MSDIVLHAPTQAGALSAEHYQTYEMALANDTVLAGTDIAQIRSYAAYARAQAQAIHKTIAATSGIDDVAAIKAEATETAQTFARVGIYADQRIGELLRDMPKAVNQHGEQVVGAPTSTRQAERDAGIDHHTSIDLQAMAANPEVVQAVLDKAEAEGRVVSRKQVLDAIRERDRYREEAEQFGEEVGSLQAEIAALEAENDRAYENGYRAAQSAQRTQPQQVVERRVEVAPSDYEAIRHERDVYFSDLQRLRQRNEEMRRELEQARLLMGEKQRDDNAQCDIEALTAATNNYLRQYGGKAWAFDQFHRVDELTQGEFVKAINSLAAFAQNMAALVAERSQLGASDE